METKEVADKYGVTRSAVLKWCLKNKVKRKLGKNGVMEYDLSEKDIKRFENRRSPGWKKGKPRKAE